MLRDSKRQMWRSNKTILLLTRSQSCVAVVGQIPLSGRDSSSLYICMSTIAEVSLSAQVKITHADKMPLTGSKTRLMRGRWTRLGTSISPYSLRLCPHHTWSVTNLPHDPDLLPRYNPPLFVWTCPQPAVSRSTSDITYSLSRMVRESNLIVL